MGSETLVHYAVNDGGDAVDGSIVSDSYHTLHFTQGNSLIGSVDSPVEGVPFAFKSVFVGTGLLNGASVATAGSMERCLKIRQQQNRQIRLEVIADGSVDGKNSLAAKLSPGTAWVTLDKLTERALPTVMRKVIAHAVKN